MALRWNARTLGLLLGVALLLGIVVHQLSYIDYDSLVGSASASAQLIRGCSDEADADTGPLMGKTVHQTWKSANVSSYSASASRDSWRAALEPLNYTVRLWTDDDVAALIRERYAWLLPTYEAYPQNIQRADVARLVLVHAHGGIYADLDVHPGSVPAISCLQRLGLEAVFAPTAGDGGLSNHFFMARRGSPFLLAALREAQRRGASTSRRILLPYLQVFWSTGPLMVTAALHDHARARTAPRPDVGLLSGDFAAAVIHHQAGRSWHGSDGRLLNYIGDHASIKHLALLLLLPCLVIVCVAVGKRRMAWRASGHGS